MSEKKKTRTEQKFKSRKTKHENSKIESVEELKKEKINDIDEMNDQRIQFLRTHDHLKNIKYLINKKYKKKNKQEMYYMYSGTKKRKFSKVAVFAFHSTIIMKLENGNPGSKYPYLYELFQGRIRYNDLDKINKEIREVANLMKTLPFEDYYFDYTKEKEKSKKWNRLYSKKKNVKTLHELFNYNDSVFSNLIDNYLYILNKDINTKESKINRQFIVKEKWYDVFLLPESYYWMKLNREWERFPNLPYNGKELKDLLKSSSVRAEIAMELKACPKLDIKRIEEDIIIARIEIYNLDTIEGVEKFIEEIIQNKIKKHLYRIKNTYSVYEVHFIYMTEKFYKERNKQIIGLIKNNLVEEKFEKLKFYWWKDQYNYQGK